MGRWGEGRSAYLFMVIISSIIIIIIIIFCFVHQDCQVAECHLHGIKTCSGGIALKDFMAF